MSAFGYDDEYDDSGYDSDSELYGFGEDDEDAIGDFVDNVKDDEVSEVSSKTVTVPSEEESDDDNDD